MAEKKPDPDFYKEVPATEPSPPMTSSVVPATGANDPIPSAHKRGAKRGKSTGDTAENKE